MNMKTQMVCDYPDIYTLSYNSVIFTKGDYFCNFWLLWKGKSFQKGSTLNGKNLLLEEQIFSFKSRTPLRREAVMKKAEFHPLKCTHLL